MKRCPNCKINYEDDTLQFCLEDGTQLIAAELSPPTVAFSDTQAETSPKLNPPAQNWAQPTQPTGFSPQYIPEAKPKKSYATVIILLTAFVMLMLFGLGFGAWYLLGSQESFNGTVNTNFPTPASSSSPSSKNSNLTLEKYSKLKEEMSYQEVKDILGGEGVEQMSSGTGKYKVTSYKWEDNELKWITVIFMGDKMSSKVQYGLK